MKTCNDCKWFKHIGTIPHVMHQFIRRLPLVDYEEVYQCNAMPIPVKLADARNECALFREKAI